MSFLTKYRPRKFSEVVGQDAVVKSVEAALKREAGKVFLFGGPSGTGKTTLARIIAQQIGCSDFDFTEVDAATETGIDNMRELCSTLMYKPFDGGTKAVIIDECHMLSRQAFTSLLKILEEPPPWVYWFLCTTEPNRVPENIRTRCLRYDLKLVPSKILGELYDRVADAEDLRIPGDVADLLIRESHGSPRRLLANMAVCANVDSRKEAAELLLAAEGTSEAIALARCLFGRPRWDDILRVIKDLGEANAESVRQVIRAYGTKIVLNSESRQHAGPALEVLSFFDKPFNSVDGITPLLLACGEYCLGQRNDHA